MRKRYKKQRREYLLFDAAVPTKWEVVNDREVHARVRGARARTPPTPPTPDNVTPRPLRTYRWDEARAEYILVRDLTRGSNDGHQPAKELSEPSDGDQDQHQDTAAADSTDAAGPSHAVDEDVGSEGTEDTAARSSTPSAAVISDAWDFSVSFDTTDEAADAADEEALEDRPPQVRPRRTVRQPAHLEDYVLNLQEALDEATPGSDDVDELRIHVLQDEYDWADLVDDLSQ